jgi:Metallopeptidase toxin 3
MRMDSDDIKKYPDCAKLIQNIKKQTPPSVWNAFFASCREDYLNGADPKHVDSVAEEALNWGKDPRVSVHQGDLVVPIGDGEMGQACGFTNTFGPKPFIVLSHVWFDAYETCGASDRDKNAGRLIRTLLHETVHWVREVAGADDVITIGGYKGTPTEAGHYFETLAYGTANICTPDEIKDAIASMRPPV